uniref:Uncharacterized protein n=2 Tax=Opuntia streptacantha TaxID=393608 RepID=A0A7C8YCW4_OPUST
MTNVFLGLTLLKHQPETATREGISLTLHSPTWAASINSTYITSAERERRERRERDLKQKQNQKKGGKEKIQEDKGGDKSIYYTNPSYINFNSVILPLKGLCLRILLKCCTSSPAKSVPIRIQTQQKAFCPRVMSHAKNSS